MAAAARGRRAVGAAAVIGPEVGGACASKSADGFMDKIKNRQCSAG